MKRIFCWMLIIGLIISLGMLGCAKKEEKEIKIGAIMPLSGNAAWLGEQHKWGIDIAVNEINTKGGINGRPLKIIYEDDKNNPLEGVNAANKLLTGNKLPVILCVASTTCMAIYKKMEENNVVLFANCGHPEIASLSDWTFRNFLTGLQETKNMAELSINKLRMNELAVLYINDSYGDGGFHIFSEAFSDLGGKIIASEKYDKDGTDFRTEITKILAKKPKAIYVIGYGNPTVKLLNQLKEFKYNGQLLGTNNFSGPPISELAKTALEGSIFTAPSFFSEGGNPKISEFILKVKTLYDKEPQWNTAVEYDAIYILAKAIGNARSPDGKSIKEELAKISNYEGIAGLYKYSQTTGEWMLGLAVMTYRNGEQIPYVKE